MSHPVRTKRLRALIILAMLSLAVITFIALPMAIHLNFFAYKSWGPYPIAYAGWGPIHQAVLNWSLHPTILNYGA